jgi:hypothetical protein
MTFAITINKIWHSALWQSVLKLSVVYAECHKQALYAECRYAECRGAVGRTTFSLLTYHLKSFLSTGVHCQYVCCGYECRCGCELCVVFDLSKCMIDIPYIYFSYLQHNHLCQGETLYTITLSLFVTDGVYISWSIFTL